MGLATGSGICCAFSDGHDDAGPVCYDVVLEFALLTGARRRASGKS